MTPTDWPNPDAPGTPLNPEKFGLHVFQAPGGWVATFEWDANAWEWNYDGDWISPIAMAANRYIYLGPVILPTEHTAAIEAATRAGIEAAAKKVMEGNMDSEMRGYASSFAKQILALQPATPTLDVMTAAAVEKEREACCDDVERIAREIGVQQCCGEGRTSLDGQSEECCGEPLLMISSAAAQNAIRSRGERGMTSPAEIARGLSTAQRRALTLIEKIVALDEPYRAINNALLAQQGDFAAHHSPIDHCVYEQVTALIDAALGDHEIGSYFLDECQTMKDGGAVHEADGRVWPLKTMDDLRAYVSRDDKDEAK